MNLKKRLVSFVLAVSIVLGMLPVYTPAAEAAAASNSDTVTLPDSGVIAQVRYWDGDKNEIVTKDYEIGDKDPTRKNVNEILTDAWRKALDYSRNSGKQIPKDKVETYDSYETRVELHLYTDWIAVNGKFNPDGDDEGFDGGELEIDGWDDAKLLLDLHGHTLDRGSTSSKKYGRVLDIYNNGSVFALVSTGKMGTVTGGWDDEGGAIRSDDDCMLFFNNIHFTGNRAEKGGALYTLDEGITYVDNCKFSGNIAEECGGAIATAEVYGEKLYTDWFYLTDSEFCDNISYGDGGAIYICDTRGDLSISGTKIYGNTAKSDGGGMYIDRDASCNVQGNSSIYNNHAGGDGGGIFLEAYYDYHSYMYLYGGDIYNNTAGSATPSPSDIHPDTGIREDAVVYVCRGFSPNYAIGIAAEENGQIVLRDLSYDGDFSSMVSKCFYSARSDQFLKTVGGYVYAEKFSGAEIGDITQFNCSISSSGPLNGAKPSHIEINNDKRAINLVFPASRASEAILAIDLKAYCAVSKGSLADFDCDGNGPYGSGIITLKNDTNNSGSYRGAFLLWGSEEVFSVPWVVTASFTNDYDATLAMRVTSGSDTFPYYTTDTNPFANGWNNAVDLLKEGNDVTVTLFRDWTAENGSFGSGGGFNDGRISINDENGGGTLTLDLHGCTIDRGLTKARDSGQVFRLSEKSKLKITDSSSQGGTITGGYNTGEGGGFYMVDSAELTLENVAVSGNYAQSGGGIDLNDSTCLTIYDGAEISSNHCSNTNSYNDGGGGICARDDSTIWLYGGRIANNTSTPKGGGIYWCSDGKLYLLGGEITGNRSFISGDVVYYYNGGGGVMVEHYFATFFGYSGSDPYVGGTVRITGNYCGPDNAVSNITLKTEKENLNHYTQRPLYYGALIGVNAAYDLGSDNRDCISASGSKFAADSSQYFFSDDDKYSIVADDSGSGDNKYQIHLAAANDANSCAITGISFDTGDDTEEYEEIVEYDTKEKRVTVTVDADSYLAYTRTRPTTFTYTGSAIRPDVDILLDYTQPQAFILTAPDGITKQTWTVQVVPNGGTWNEYELRIYGGKADRHFYYPGEKVTITAEDRDDAVFSYWNINGGSMGWIAEGREYTFTMPAVDVQVDGMFVDALNSVLVDISELKADGSTLGDVSITASHNVGAGTFKTFAPAWYDKDGVLLPNSTVIQENTPYTVTLTLEPVQTCAPAAQIQCTVNREEAYASVYQGSIVVSATLYSGEAQYADITVKDETGAEIPAHLYSITNDGKLTAGKAASFIPEDYTEGITRYRVSSVTGITDADPIAEGWQFTVEDPTEIVVSYEALEIISALAVELPAVEPMEPMPAALSGLSAEVTASGIQWEPFESAAEFNREYEGSVTLTPAQGYVFADSVSVDFENSLFGTYGTVTFAPTYSGKLNISFVIITEKDRITAVSVPGAVSITRGESLSLPEKVAVTSVSGRINAVEVEWYEPYGFSTDKPGTYTFTGVPSMPEDAEFAENATGIDTHGQIYVEVTVVSLPQLAAPTALAETADMEIDGALRRCTVIKLQAESGADIYYTTDGTDPATSETKQLYTEGIVLSSDGTHTVKTVAVKENHTTSGVAAYEYTVTVPQVYTLTRQNWVDGAYVESSEKTITAVAGETLTVTADTLTGKAFLGYEIEINGSTERGALPVLSFTMPASDVRIEHIYVSYTDSVTLAGIDAPVAYMPLDTQAAASVTLPYDGPDADSDKDVVSHDGIVVTWTDASGKAVTKAEYGKAYTGTVTLKDSGAAAVIFSDSVTVSGIEGATAAKTDGRLVITFTMTAGKVAVTESRTLTPTGISVELDTTHDAAASRLPASLNVPTAAGELPVSVTWMCEGYDGSSPGSYTFTAQFGLTDAGILLPEGLTLSASAVVSVKTLGKLAPPSATTATEDRVIGEKTLRCTVVQLHTDAEGAAIYYTTDGTDPAASQTKQLYTEGIVLSESGEHTVRAVAVKEKYTTSDAAEFVFNITVQEVCTLTVESSVDGTTRRTDTLTALSGSTVLLHADSTLGFFTGWYVGEGTEPVSTASAFNYPVTGSAAVTARYTGYTDTVEISGIDPLIVHKAPDTLAEAAVKGVTYPVAVSWDNSNAPSTDLTARTAVLTLKNDSANGIYYADTVSVHFGNSTVTAGCTGGVLTVSLQITPVPADMTANAVSPISGITVMSGTPFEGTTFGGVKLPEKYFVQTTAGNLLVPITWDAGNYTAETAAGTAGIYIRGTLQLGDFILSGSYSHGYQVPVTITASSVAAPSASLTQQSYDAAQTLVLTSDPGASIFYTLSSDGTLPADPTESSAAYPSGGIALSGEAGKLTTYIVKAMAKKDSVVSNVSVFHYQIDLRPTLTVTGGTLQSGQAQCRFTAGESLTVVAAEPESGKYFKGWSTDGGSSVIPGAGETYTFAGPAGNVTYTAVYGDRAVTAVSISVDEPRAGAALPGAVSYDLTYNTGELVRGSAAAVWTPTGSSAVRGETYELSVSFVGNVFADGVTVTCNGAAAAAGEVEKSAAAVTFKRSYGPLKSDYVSHTNPEDIVGVSANTSFADIALSAKVTVQTADGTAAEIAVSWSRPAGALPANTTVTVTGRLAETELNTACITGGGNAVVSVNVSSETITVAAPSADVQPGTYYEEKSLSLTAESGADIYYTTDGSEPTATNGTLYEAPLTLAGSPVGVTTAVKAVAVRAGVYSEVVEYSYTVKLPITVKVTGGMLPDGSITGQFLPGEQVTVLAGALTAYTVFDGWSAEGITIAEGDRRKTSYTFTAPTTDVTITASYRTKKVSGIDISMVTPAAGDPLAETAVYNMAMVSDAAVLGEKITPIWSPAAGSAVRGGSYTVRFIFPSGYEYASDIAITLNGKPVGTTGWNSSDRTVTYTFPTVTEAYHEHTNPPARTNVPAGTKYAELLPKTVKVTTAGGDTVDIAVDWTLPAENAIEAGESVTVMGVLNGKALTDAWITGGENAKVAAYVSAVMATVAVPTAVPGAGQSYRGSVEVSLYCTTGDATIYYTTDGSEPTTAGIPYTGPFTLSETCTVRAIAAKDGMMTSAAASFTYTVVPTYTAAVVNGVGGGVYAAGETVTITAQAQTDRYFTGWETTGTAVTLADAAASTTTFTMPAGDVQITAKYADRISEVAIRVDSLELGAELPTPRVVSDGVTIGTVWTPAGPVAANTIYTVQITLTDDGGKGFAEHGTVYVNGSEVSSAMNDNGEVTVYYQVMSTADRYESHDFDDSSITDVPYGTALADMGLPTSAVIRTTGGSEYTAAISWDFENCTYEPGGEAAQEFEVMGVIVLPTGIEGADPEVRVTVKVNGKPVDPPHIPPVDPVIPPAPPAVPPVMPGTPVAPDSPCSGGAGCLLHSFSDLDHSAWYHEAVEYVLREGMMNGVGHNRFDPHGTASRAMIVTILWRLEGCPTADGRSFSDIAEGAWYAEAVRWAASNGIVNGYGDYFEPDRPVSREQIAAILYRYAKYRGCDVSVGETTNILSYTDAEEVSGWAVEAIQWAVGSGLMEGDGVNLTPGVSATRCQSAALLMRFVESIVR